MCELVVDLVPWAEQQFSNCKLGDRRRNKRLIKYAAQVASHPDGSTPDQTETWADCKAAYRLFDMKEVTFSEIIEPHCQLTRAAREGTWLLIGDTSEIDFGFGRKVKGLKPLGNGFGKGFMLHSSMMLNPETNELVGLAAQELYYRKPAPPKENSTQRKKRARESEIWGRVVDQVGAAPAGARFIHVFDRGADDFETYCRLLLQDTSWVVRVAQQHRNIIDPQGKKQSVRAYLDSLPSSGTYTLRLRATKDHPPRVATIHVKFGGVIMPRSAQYSPWVKATKILSIPMYVVEAREIDAPQGVEPLHWVLMTRESVRTFEDAWTVIGHYEKRPLIEEYHKAMKTGCRLEERQYRTADRLERVAGVLSVMGVRLVQLKMIARTTPDRPAREVVPRRWIKLLQALASVRKTWTSPQFETSFAISPSSAVSWAANATESRAGSRSGVASKS